MCYVYMKTRNVSYFLYNKSPNMEGFQDFPECLHLGQKIDIHFLENSALGLR